MPYVIFFKKVNKRSIVNYENENFHKYLLDFKEKLTTNKSVRVSYRRKNNNIGEMRAQMNELRGMMKQVLENKKEKAQKNDNPGSTEGISMNDPAVLALFFKGFAKYLQDEGYISKKPLNQRNVANGNSASISDGPFSSISGSNLTLWKLNELKNKISDPNFASPLEDKNATANRNRDNSDLNTWSSSKAKKVVMEYNKLCDTVNELKNLLNALEIK